MSDSLATSHGPFDARDTFETGHGPTSLYRLSALEDDGFDLQRLPISIRILLEGLFVSATGQR